MGKINKLPKNIWELIAAGEVVERPASVVKELLENSIDAGATDITVEIQNGGVRYIRITDNGCGIARDDVPLAFVSHATSKISSAQDLDAIMTLGFRGEALSSVAAVSKTEIITKTRDEEVGTRMEIFGGEQVSLDDAGCPNGTTIIIRELFYNTPARMKFLKSDKSEAMAVAGIVDKIALSHPEISIRFIKDGRQTLCTDGTGELKNAIYSVYGDEFSESMIPVLYELNGMKIKGFVSKPFYARGSGSMQLFFANNRYIKSKTASAALNEAYKNSIMVGKYPACVIFIEMIPELLDVNVHPAKTEVRFSNEKAIFELVYYAAKNAISNDASRPQAQLKSKPVSDILQPPIPEAEQADLYSLNSEAATDKPPVFSSSPVINTEENIPSRIQLNTPERVTYKKYNYEDEIDLSVKTAEAFSNPFDDDDDDDETVYSENPNKDIKKGVDSEVAFKYLGEAFKTYIFAEYNGKLAVIDKHAAHERMLYNKLKKDNGSNGSQLMLKPCTVVLSKEEYVAVTENLEMIRSAGFEIDDFGDGSVIVRACPLNLENEDVTQLITEIAGYLTQNKRDILPEQLDWVYHSIACRAAIKAGNKQTDYELIEFTKQLLSDESVRYCPHGRPVLIELTKYELDKQFGRV
ncbi:MAG: DNA mismatch repair endonuclease MutL [Candidatus Fimenecus sp.]|nr:DNA mismatch repair endonuclease MutL [Candidatus Fimenecus sp.]